MSLSFSHHSIPIHFDRLSSCFSPLTLLGANDSPPYFIQASKQKPLHLCTTFPSCTLPTSYFLFLSVLFSIRVNHTRPNLYEHTSWGVNVFFYFLFSVLLHVCSPPFQRCSHSPFFSPFVCCIYLRSSYSHNCAVIVVEGGLRAVMMFAKTPPDEEQ